MKKADAVRSCSLFNGYPEPFVLMAVDAFVERRFEEGGEVFFAGEFGSSMFIVESGMVRIAATLPDGREEVMGTLVSGEHFGSLSLLSPGPRMVSARADEGTIVLELSMGGLDKLKKIHPQFAVRLLLSIASDFANASRENGPFLLKALDVRLGSG
jgi:CRP-like cAMP-binding protein